MKKHWKMLLCVVISATMLASCGKSDEESSQKADKSGDVNGDGKVVVGYISKNTVEPSHAQINDYARVTLDAMSVEGAIDEWTDILDGASDAVKQSECASECIGKACDYVIILPAEATASDAAVVQMAEAGIKVIVVNTKTDSTEAVAHAYVGPDNFRAGEMLAEWVIENYPEGGQYIHIQGNVNNIVQIARGEGIANVMEKYSEFELLQTISVDWQIDNVINRVVEAIDLYKEELAAIICDSDEVASTAQKICNDNGRPDIICVGADGVKDALQMVKDGNMGAVVLEDGLSQIAEAMDVLKTSLKGGTTKGEILVPFVLVTSENAEQYIK